MAVEPSRIRALNPAPMREDAKYVLYWSQMNRRVESNHAPAYAGEVANDRGVPLLVYEGLTYDYRGANDRIHTFVLEGVPETVASLARLHAGHFFYLRARSSSPNDVLYRLAAGAVCVITDDYPVFIASDHNKGVPRKIGVSYIAVDSSCIVPMSVHPKQAYAAFSIRPKINAELPKYLIPVDPIRLKRCWSDDLLPAELKELRTEVTHSNIPRLVAGCEINRSIKPSISFTDATSDLSPYLHFGQISSLEVALRTRDHAQEHKLMDGEFLEELIVRRELSFNFARFCPSVETLDILPNWCRKTMAKHASDQRPHVYSREQLETGQTADALWNAAQKELLLRGKIHGYYRMYWGKKVIEWTRTYEEARRLLIDFHDVYALDGRDPNTYANVLWLFGLHDRPWFERPIFGQLRYMSFEGMRRKTDTAAYIEEIAALERI